jgi:hypothetical protein
MGNITNQFTELEDVELEGICIKSRIRWMQHGNACKKQFFKVIMEKNALVFNYKVEVKRLFINLIKRRVKIYLLYVLCKVI